MRKVLWDETFGLSKIFSKFEGNYCSGVFNNAYFEINTINHMEWVGFRKAGQYSDYNANLEGWISYKRWEISEAPCCLRGLYTDRWVEKMANNKIWTNATGCYRWPLDMICTVFNEACGLPSLLLWKNKIAVHGQSLYETPWDTCVYGSYSAWVVHCHVVLLESYSNVSTLSKSGTQSATFHSVRFENLQGAEMTGTLWQ